MNSNQQWPLSIVYRKSKSYYKESILFKLYVEIHQILQNNIVYHWT